MDTFSQDPSFIPLPESQCDFRMMIGEEAAVGGKKLAVAGLSNFRVPQAIQDRVNQNLEYKTLSPELLTRVYLYHMLQAAEGLADK
ncbi:hypothetical protein GO988_14360 [Hymenobacter sp. HMF4947]|uniref:Uncharacterized protein n=1 Tax=Hymenobacter ginkgonis TaxID=2682976 RepID=A0A7K1TGH5_9BACT|nr:hypothetical protein [Hymenobacter ginkgonis]MVN77515.1 hypothetical protein [Hymenobacter ginkgonis]